MRFALILLLLSACNSEKGDQSGEEAGGAASGLSEVAPESAAKQAARLEAVADAALKGALREPLYSNLREGHLGAICGYVDSKQKNGKYRGPRPFLVTPEGVPLVSTTPRIMFEDPVDIFPDFYIRWCASPEEMRSIAPLIASRAEAPAPEADDGLPPAAELPIDPLLLDPVPSESTRSTTPQAQAEPKATPKTPAPSGGGDEDSFLNAVVRKPGDTKSGE